MAAPKISGRNPGKGRKGRETSLDRARQYVAGRRARPITSGGRPHQGPGSIAETNHEMTKKHPPVSVRPVTPADFEAWKPHWDDYNAFYERVGPTALPDEVTETTWR